MDVSVGVWRVVVVGRVMMTGRVRSPVLDLQPVAHDVRATGESHEVSGTLSAVI